jgi:hypothetical protein
MSFARRSGRSLLALAFAAALLGGVGGPARAAAAFVPTAVTFKVDDAAKTITATIKIAFYNRSCAPGQSCAVPAADVARIVKAIEDTWNNGSTVKCYTFVVKVEARAVEGQSEAGKDEVDIGLDYGPVTIRAFVHGQHHGNNATGPLGNTDDDRVEALHDPAAPTSWPAVTKPSAYGHEVGHLLGLDDNYASGVSGPLPGTSEDLMFWNYGGVSDEMATRAVARSGQVDLKKLKCGWYTEGTQELQWVGKHCDGTDPEWVINAELTDTGLTANDLYTATIDPTSHKGTYAYESIGTTGPAVFTKNGKGVATTGEQKDGTLLMSFSEIIVHGVITAPGVRETISVPIPAITFTWRTATAAECP